MLKKFISGYLILLIIGGVIAMISFLIEGEIGMIFQTIFIEMILVSILWAINKSKSNNKTNKIENKHSYNDYKEHIQNLMQENNNLKLQLANYQKIIESNKHEFGTIKNEFENIKSMQGFDNLEKQHDKLKNKIKSMEKKLAIETELYHSLEHCIENFLNLNITHKQIKLPKHQITDLNIYSPTVILNLHSLDVKELQASFRENQKQIDELARLYQQRYIVKSNQAIYSLLGLSLKAELQNILIHLKTNKLDEAIEKVKKLTLKYMFIADMYNDNTVTTLQTFLGQIEHLLINAVKIEYNYYVRKEQIRLEQVAINEQRRQEREELKAIENEKKKIEKEEKKYQAEIQKVAEAMQYANDEQKRVYEIKILELQKQLSSVVEKKEEITRLALGKAGHVYIISNLGSFGENMFKVGMTRRMNPEDRVTELGDASVPFRFDVHSFIFPEDAVALENKLHKILENRRVNKVNRRKEFFYTNVDELEQIVHKIEPTAEFTKTMICNEYRQSQSI